MRDHIQYINVIRIRLKSIKQNTYWIVRNTKGHSSKKLDPTVLNFLSHMSWMRDHVWYKFYETHTNGTEIVKQNTYLTVVTKGHNSNKPDSQIQFSYNLIWFDFENKEFKDSRRHSSSWNQYCAHSFARNWQLPFLNQRKGENDRRKYFMINLHERMLPTSAGVEPATSWSPVGWRIQMSHRGQHQTD